MPKKARQGYPVGLSLSPRKNHNTSGATPNVGTTGVQYLSLFFPITYWDTEDQKGDMIGATSLGKMWENQMKT